ncbi:MAG: alkaline phosphatase family protein [Bacteroidetes bacterium]|nr:alkaline phosphatase family protein [Bacteroidota bacterium]
MRHLIQKNFRSIFFLLLQFQILYAQDTTQKIIQGRENSIEQQKKPYVILISADGFRYDVADKFHATNLINFRSKGVQAEYMQPCFPSLTFPNHYSIVTGLYPAHHGIVDNTFYDEKKNAVYSLGNKKAVIDSSWYGGTPLWVLAEKQKMVSASFYWVASESAIQGVRPTYYYAYGEAIPIETRIQTVKRWLQLPEKTRPHMITFYFPEVDHQEHIFGVDSKETAEAVHFVDESMGKLVRTVDSLHLNVNFIFLADHGMMNLDTLNGISLPAAVDTNKFLVLPALSLLHLYAKDTNDVRPTYEALKKEARDYDVYLTSNTPAHWHYGKKEDAFNRLGNILLVPHPPKAFNIRNRRLPAAEHGYDPSLTEMHATFYAWGPAFAQHKKIAKFENINVYPMIAKILGLKIVDPIDGKAAVLDPILKKKK